MLKSGREAISNMRFYTVFDDDDYELTMRKILEALLQKKN